MPKPKNITSPSQIATRQTDGEATIYMYGVVGQRGEWWLDAEDQQEEITAMAVIKALNELSADNAVIHFRINSPGGDVFEGEAIRNAIRNCSAEVHTYNDGVAASMAAVIWLAGAKRFMGRNTTMMIHAPLSFCMGNAVAMREQADKLDKFTEASAEGIADLTDLTVDEVQARFFADGKDHWMTYKDVEALGFLSAGEDYEVAQQLPANVQQFAYPQLLQHFVAMPDTDQSKPFLSRVRQWVSPKQTAPTPVNPEPVKPQDLRAAIDSGELTSDQINQVMADIAAEEAAKNPAPPVTAQALTETIQLAVKAGLEEHTKPLLDEIEVLKGQVKQLGDSPGDDPAGLGKMDDKKNPKMTAVQQDSDFFSKMADEGRRPFRNPASDIRETA